MFDHNFENKYLIKVNHRDDHPPFGLVKTIKQYLENILKKYILIFQSLIIYKAKIYKL